MSSTNSSNAVFFTITDFSPYSQSIPSQVINSLSLMCFVALLSLVFYLYSKKDLRERMKTNQKILVGIVVVLVAFHSTSLVCRLIYRSIEESIVSQMDYHVTTSFSPSSREYMEYIIFRNSTLTTDQAGISFASIITMHVVGSIEAFTTLTCVAILLLIISFVSNVFLNTVIANNSNKKAFKIALIGVNVVTAVFLVALTLAFLLIAVSNGPIRWKMIPDFRLPIYLTVFSLVTVIIMSQIIISSISAGLVIHMIRKVAHHQNSSGTAKRSFIKILILEGILITFAFVFLVAIVVLVMTVFWSYNYIIWDLMNNFSVLMFLLATIFMYFPLFEKHEEKNLKEGEPTAVRSNSQTPRSANRTNMVVIKESDDAVSDPHV
ncbi:hypothetical protein C9374_014458 [Naegleria lovaniensis]|uniref:Uncharacterized protein n=1 Tax=Naegleria lovaniensis TaxID=51637 RepID=A0AA88GZ46_NAELO|nr:uncharacterized protein C9374_014458 [Naegleria lovaniensis]KAG2389058.1 hypothetical protein C9374_014458 [Naegleria lovaniensis]